MQKVDELKIFRSVPHMINTDCDAMQTHRLSCYILLRRSACTSFFLNSTGSVFTAYAHAPCVMKNMSYSNNTHAHVV